jgi:AcrR family transcriptional regulator
MHKRLFELFKRKKGVSMANPKIPAILSENETSFSNKKEEIIYAAAKLMSKKGFDATTMLDIANEVGMLKGSLYHHFSSKEEIFFHVLNKGIDTLYGNAINVFNSEENPREKLRKIIKCHALHLMNDNVSMVIFSQERKKLISDNGDSESYIAKRDSYENHIRLILKQGIKEGFFPAEIDIKLTSFCILGMLNWLIQWFRPEGSLSSDAIADYMGFLICDLMLKKA